MNKSGEGIIKERFGGKVYRCFVSLLAEGVYQWEVM